MQETIDRLAYKLGLPKKEVVSIYNTYWQFIRETIEELPLPDLQSEDEYNKLKTSFNIPYLGKLYCNWKGITNQKNYLNAKYKKD